MSGATQRKKIGDVMVERGLIRREWVDDILAHSKEENVRFGEAAVALGFITEDELRNVLLQPYKNQTYFELEPQYFPRVTQDLFSMQEILKFGILPLGYKSEFHWFRTRKRLNLGMLNPNRFDALAWVKEHSPTVKAFKTFQVLPDQFLVTLEQVYGVKKEELMSQSADALDENLTLYLQLERRNRRRA